MLSTTVVGGHDRRELREETTDKTKRLRLWNLTRKMRVEKLSTLKLWVKVRSRRFMLKEVYLGLREDLSTSH